MSSLEFGAHAAAHAIQSNETRAALTPTKPKSGETRSCRRVSPLLLSHSATKTPLWKRLFDCLGAGVAMTLVSPLAIVLSVAIKLESSGPVIFRQQRVGKDGRVFEMLKLRSMCDNAESLRLNLELYNEMRGGVLFKLRKDPRITLVGKFIRRWSLDELPQLWNVWRGEMSLVGPRPALPSEVERYPLDAWRRLDVQPGLTCLWQVRGRSNLPFEKQIELDLIYVDEMCPALDIRILVETIPAVLSGNGAR